MTLQPLAATSADDLAQRFVDASAGGCDAIITFAHGFVFLHTGCESDRKRGPQRDPVGYDAAKKTKGIKRNVIVDTIGLLLGIAVIPANIQDRDGAANLIRKTRHLFPWIAKIFADGGYAGAKLKAALAGQPVELEIVKRTDNEGGFKVVRRRWVIERTLSWLRRNRRLMAHYEAFVLIAEGFAKLAMICVMLKRLTRAKGHVRHVKF